MHFSLGLYTYIKPQAGWGAYNLRAAFACANVCVCVCVCVYIYMVVRWLITRHYVLSSLNCRQSPSDRNGATTFVCVCVAMCRCISRCLVKWSVNSKNNVQGNRSVLEEGEGQ